MKQIKKAYTMQCMQYNYCSEFVCSDEIVQLIFVAKMFEIRCDLVIASDMLTSDTKSSYRRCYS